MNSTKPLVNLCKRHTDDFEYLNVIGKGSFGQVFRVRKKHGKDEDQIYAMKAICKYYIASTTSRFKHAVTELNILKSIKHPFIVELKYVFQDRTLVFFVMEYLSGGDLDKLLTKMFTFLEPMAAFYIKEIILAIEYLHRHNIIHRDIKPQNVLLDADGHVKLSDFGLSNNEVDDKILIRTICGTSAYMAPEMKSGKGYGKAADWWSLGIMLYKMLTGHTPSKNFVSEARKDQNNVDEFWKSHNFTLPTIDLLKNLININANERLGASGATEVKNHPFFVGTIWDSVYQRLVTPPFIPGLPNFTRDHNVKLATLDTPCEVLLDSKLIDRVHEQGNELFKEFSYTHSELTVQDNDATEDIFVDSNNTSL